MQETPEIENKENLIASKIPIGIYYLCRDSNEALPYFFIKWAPDDKRYRVSTSFKYLNKTYGLRINIIRDVSKIADNNIFEKFIQKFKELPFFELNNSLHYKTYLDQEHKTEIFMVERDYLGEKNTMYVFFSLDYWTFGEYLKALNDLKG